MFLSRNRIDSGAERKIGLHCNFSFQTGNSSLPVDTAHRGRRARAASGSEDGSEDLNRGDPAKPGRRRFKPQDGTLALRAAPWDEDESRLEAG